MDLKETDYKLLSYLYHNHNEPLSKIAKAVKLSRDQVEYRINKYLKEGLIRKFVPIFNWNKLGYSIFATFLLKFEKPRMIENFLKNLSKSKNLISYGKVYGKYDIWINYLFEGDDELNNFSSKLFENEEEIITDYLIIKPYFTEMYPLKFFNHKNREDYNPLSKEKESKIDKIDIQILKILSENGREKLINIASKTGISVEKAFYKIKRLKSERILLGNRIQFNMSILGYFFTPIMINFRSFSEKNKEKIKTFVKNSKNANSLMFNLQKPNCILQIFHKEEKEVREEIEKLKKLFEDESIELETLGIGEEEGLINSLPFI